jgi:acyl-CoA thioester hydrolase
MTAKDLHYRFRCPVKVRYIEVDAQQHVFFGHYLTYFDIALVEYMREIGHAYPDMISRGADMFYAHAECDYHGRARFEDVLNVHARIGHIGNTSFTFDFSIYRQVDDALVATGKIVAVAVDVDAEQPTSVPEALRQAVRKYEDRQS